jgi:ornithine cyclodeaminase/alanine dehydrogenase-like protein (mu-crystallin family)
VRSWPASTAPPPPSWGRSDRAPAPGRRDRDEITVYKAMGHVIEDIVAAEIVYHRAREQETGRTVEL